MPRPESPTKPPAKSSATAKAKPPTEPTDPKSEATAAPPGAPGNPITFYQGEKDQPGTRSVSFFIATERVEGNGDPVPKKLGDGNFGMVFEAPYADGSPNAYALKVLYKHRSGENGDEETGTGKRRDAELTVGREVPETLKRNIAELTAADPQFPRTGDMQLRRLVAPIAYATDFIDFAGRETLEKQDIAFSKYAYVMEKFEETLKDQVERTDAEGNGERTDTRGYGRLRGASKIERARSAIPIATQLAQGLQVLHAAGMRHQDIKPANIYYRVNDEGEISYRLGDLGFLLPHDPTLGGTGAASLDMIGIGTKHYRSIEQVDFNDTAECDLTPDPEAANLATLVTHDPKFQKTIIRRGDRAILAKSATHRMMTVERVEADPTSTKTTIKVRLTRPEGRDEDGKPEGDFLVRDSKTQVSFFKNPSAKTDLFGLGSIVFDIISAGDSPERFYELLRSYDRGDKEVADIVKSYEVWQAGSLDDPDIAAIFNRISGSNRNEELDQDLMSFVLRAMMSDTADSIYNTNGFSKAEGSPRTADGSAEEAEGQQRVAAVKAWRMTIDALATLSRDLGAGDYKDPKINLLTRESPAGFGPNTMPTIQPRTQVKLIKALPSYLAGRPPNWPDGLDGPAARDRRVYRWMAGAILVRRMASAISAKIVDLDHSLTALSREDIVVTDTAVTFRQPVYGGDKGALEDRLAAGDPIVTRLRPYSSRFEPIWWRYGTRRANMLAVADHEAQVDAPATDSASPADDAVETDSTADPAPTVDASECPLPPPGQWVRFDLVDFAFAAPTFGQGDFVLAGDRYTEVYQIAEVQQGGVFRIEPQSESPQNGAVRVRPSPEPAGTEGTANSLGPAFLLKRPDPVDYYGGMLAIYLFHLLISGGAGQDEPIDDFPPAVYARIRDYPVSFDKVPSAPFGTAVGEADTFQKWTVRLITWLSLGGFASVSEGDPRTNRDKWNAIETEINLWFRGLESLAERRGDLDGVNILDPNGFERLLDDHARLRERFGSVPQDLWVRTTERYMRGDGHAEGRGLLSRLRRWQGNP